MFEAIIRMLATARLSRFAPTYGLLFVCDYVVMNYNLIAVCLERNIANNGLCFKQNGSALKWLAIECSIRL